LDTFELNKIAGAFLGTLLFAMWLNVISSAIFTPAKLVKPGYPLPAAQETASAGNGAPAPAIAPIEDRLAKADVKKGELDTKPCQACHNFDKGGVTKIGPPLYDVVDRPKATVNGFSYSDAIKSKGGKWTYADLDQFLADPKGYAPGTKMTFAGEADPIKRADIIDYLHILSDIPEPLPASRSAALPGGASTEPALPQPKERAVSVRAEPLPANGSAGASPPRKHRAHSSTKKADNRRN
jgi:cytochrome c